MNNVKFVVTDKGKNFTCFMLFVGKNLCHGGVIMLSHNEFSQFMDKLDAEVILASEHYKT